MADRKVTESDLRQARIGKDADAVVARRVNISRERVRQWRARLGIALSPGATERARRAPEAVAARAHGWMTADKNRRARDRAELTQLQAEGMSLADAAVTIRQKRRTSVNKRGSRK